MVLGFVSVQTQASGPHHCYTHGTGVGQLLCYMQGLLKQENSDVQLQAIHSSPWTSLVTLLKFRYQHPQFSLPLDTYTGILSKAKDKEY